MDNLPFNWFDIFLLIWLGMGIFRGRKRGMSEELMTFVQWIAIVVVCAFTYQPLGAWLHRTAKTAPLTSYIIAYLTVAIVLTAIFLLVKRSLGGKLMGSDVFGKSEYYLGMPAGMLRFLCMAIVGLAILNARLYSREEIAAYQKFQMENYGSEFFPGLQSLQSTVFEQSIAGPPIKKFFGFLLIKPTNPEGGKFKQKEWMEGTLAVPPATKPTRQSTTIKPKRR
jgi:uncharacterized membrane protein required for colicin V production